MATPESKKVVEFRSVAPGHCIHVDERSKTVGSNRTVPILIKVEFTPVGGRQEDYHKNGGRYITSDPEIIQFLREHTGNVKNGGKAYQEVAPGGRGLDNELAQPAELKRANQK